MMLIQFLKSALHKVFRGSKLYWCWLGLLTAIAVIGVWHYIHQLQSGLVATGMSDQVSWGFYISNFAFLVGIAASSVLLVIPAFIFHREDIKQVVMLGEGMAVAALVMAMLFVIVDLGRPDRLWHMIPLLGRFNFPVSLLAWDIVVLVGYLLLNLAIPFYVHYSQYKGREPNLRGYFPFVVLGIFWAISIHTVTAFLFSANPARPFWHIALLAPRFIASAFVSGPALIIIMLQIIRRMTRYPVSQRIINTTALIMTVAMHINLFFIGTELFTDFYSEGEHAASIRYLYFGLRGFSALQPWILAALALNVIAVIILTIHPLRRNTVTLNIACVFAFVGIWLEKGMGLVVPGFIPTPLGEIFEYSPTVTEIAISFGIWAVGLLIFTLLAKTTILTELGELRYGNGNTLDD